MRASRINRPIFFVVRLLLMECLPNVASCEMTKAHPQPLLPTSTGSVSVAPPSVCETSLMRASSQEARFTKRVCDASPSPQPDVHEGSRHPFEVGRLER